MFFRLIYVNAQISRYRSSHKCILFIARKYRNEFNILDYEVIMKKPVCMLIGICMIISILFCGCTEDSSSKKDASSSFPTINPLWKNTQASETEPQKTEPAETEAATETEPEPETVPPPVLDDAAIQAVIDDVASQYGAVGIQVAVVDNGQIAGLYATGWATKNDEPMTPEHKLRVASISKIIIGIAAMKLQEDGILSLGSDISKFWQTEARNPNYPDIPITIDSLLTHTSTVTPYANDGPMDYNTVRNRLTYGYGYGTPGEIGSWGYNNYAFRLLGMTLELAARQTLDNYLKENLFAHMGIDAGFAPGDLENTDLLATLYWENNYAARTLQEQKNMHGPVTPGEDGFHYSGGLTISAAELAKIMVLLTNDGIYDGRALLSPESVAMMEEIIPYLLYDGTYQARPMSYIPELYSREGIYFHTGSGWGVYNCFSYDPATGDGVVVLTNGASGGTDATGIYSVCSQINQYIYNEIAQ